MGPACDDPAAVVVADDGHGTVIRALRRDDGEWLLYQRPSSFGPTPECDPWRLGAEVAQVDARVVAGGPARQRVEARRGDVPGTGSLVARDAERGTILAAASFLVFDVSALARVDLGHDRDLVRASGSRPDRRVDDGGVAWVPVSESLLAAVDGQLVAGVTSVGWSGAFVDPVRGRCAVEAPVAVRVEGTDPVRITSLDQQEVPRWTDALRAGAPFDARLDTYAWTWDPRNQQLRPLSYSHEPRTVTLTPRCER